MSTKRKGNNEHENQRKVKLSSLQDSSQGSLMLFDFLSRGVKFTDPKGRFNFNTRTGIAKVNGDVTEKYARKLLQDALKEKTPYKGGWYITFRDFNKNKDADGQYDFEISNIFASNMKVNV